MNKRFRLWYEFPVAAVAVLCAPAGVAGQTGEDTLRVARVTSPPIIDGQLREPFWTERSGVALKWSTLGAPSERTAVWIATDRSALFVAARLDDSEIGSLTRRKTVSTEGPAHADHFSLVLQPGSNGPIGYVFSVDPGGATYQGRLGPMRIAPRATQPWLTAALPADPWSFDGAWTGDWDASVTRDSAGWTVEMRIAWRSLEFGVGTGDRWGVNFVRGIRRTSEIIAWTSVSRAPARWLDRPLGTVGGLGPSVGLAGSVTPWAAGVIRRRLPLLNDEPKEVEAGGVGYLRAGPGLRLTASYRPDFRETEFDEQRINLTRFPLYYPDKRSLFREASGMFGAPLPDEIELFHSRRIGFDSIGRPIPVVAIARVQATIFDTPIIGYQAFTEAVPGSEVANSYTALRIQRRIGPLTLGGLAVQRTARDSSSNFNRTIAGDGLVRFGRGWVGEGWGATTETPRFRGGGGAFGGAIRRDGDRTNLRVGFAQVGELFNPEVGFVERRAFRRFDGAVAVRFPLSPRGFVTALEPSVSYRGHFNLDGFHESGKLIAGLGLRLPGGAAIRPSLETSREGLLFPFAITPTITLPRGQYTWTQATLDYHSDGAKAISLAARLELGGRYNGRSLGGAAVINARLIDDLGLSVLAEYHDVRLTQGTFARSRVGVRIDGTLFDLIALNILGQFDNQSSNLGLNAGATVTTGFGTTLDLVFNEAKVADGLFQWKRSKSRSISLKVAQRFGVAY